MSIERLRQVYYRLPEGFQRAVLVRRRQAIWIRTGIVFIHVPKAAGTTINESLYGRFMGHIRASDVERWGSPAARALPRFAILRNPWDRLLSAYRFVTRGGGIGGPNAGRPRHARQYRTSAFETFERFVNDWLAVRDPRSLDPVFQPQHLYVCDDGGRVIVDHLGRFEDLESTYAFLQSKVRGGVGAVGHSNRSGDPVDFRRFYTPSLVDTVARLYSDDIRRFGYEFE